MGQGDELASPRGVDRRAVDHVIWCGLCGGRRAQALAPTPCGHVLAWLSLRGDCAVVSAVRGARCTAGVRCETERCGLCGAPVRCGVELRCEVVMPEMNRFDIIDVTFV